MPKLRIEREGDEPRTYDGSLVTIGRARSNTLTISDARISSVHGEIVRREGQFFYRDLGSTNGSLVRGKLGEIVVDGKRVREAELFDGDSLLLGDRNEPVTLKIAIPKEDPSATVDRTIVARRAMGSAAELGTQVVENPLANRQTLAQLFAFYAEISPTRRPRDLTDVTCRFVLDLLSKNLFVAAYLHLDEVLTRTSLVTRDAARTPVVSVEELERWFPDVFAGQAAMVINAPLPLAKRAPDLQMLAAAPLPGERGLLGVAIVGRRAKFSDFDLDLLTLIAHHCAVQLEKIALIDQLSQANLQLSTENRDLREQLDTPGDDRPIIGESTALQRALKQADMVARTDTTVLVLGETGTGKELVARYVHDQSGRAGQRFAAVNCGALAETLLESELFGYSKGAFTGAERDKKGLFQMADGGTLFLDEIGDVSPGLQVRLLRALEAGEITPVGSTQPVRVDVRIIGATNRNLDKEVAEGRFREDLLYRINVFPIELPPLRNRPGDITLLAEHFLARYSERLGKQIGGFDKEVLARLESYAWPGNIRELQNEVHRAVLLSDHDTIGLDLLSERIGGATAVPIESGPLKEMMAKVESLYLQRMLKEHDDNRTQTAKTLGISRQALTEKLKKYGITRKSGGKA